ncbi:uncharacterized protein LY89DRAFT_738377 [Mollisia scopiformis]|uniref:Zn(2)-C6 fungal-type domain-containing protein n=1 Tax=Mollisia scopiformis TaxID=149040 RepID=A0A194WX94_MOLSC|nr:uncharacterized protein LY89DRAFT_738377 [Mollisia scopiformis]KUJ12603.1 hypothetical protein LY89DRAFT_738377 [Mollisia scopiformis]
MAVNQSATPPLKDCRTCNRRRIRCDRSLPTCQKCKSRNLECPGYGVNFRWKEATKARLLSNRPVPSRISPENTIFPTGDQSTPNQNGRTSINQDQSISSETRVSSAPSLPESIQDPVSRQLLHHFNQILAPLLAWVDSTDNPWQNIILPLAIESPPLLHSLLAMAAGDISDRYYGCAHMAADTVYGFTRNRNKALELLAEHLRQDLAVSNASNLQSQANNHILASIVVLCYHEIKWPSSGLWKVHLRAARTMIRRWSTTDFISPTSDTTRSFLIQELSATQAMASVTSFMDEEPVRVRVPNDHRAPFLGFLHIVQAVSLAARKELHAPNVSICLMDVGHFFQGLERAKQHAFAVGLGLTFRSSQSQLDFEHMVNMYYETGYIYTFQTLSSPDNAAAEIRQSHSRLMGHLHQLADTSLFAQDLPWPLFIAGTECGGRIEEQQYIESRMNEMVRLTGTLDRMKALRFLKEFWTSQSHASGITWIQLAKTWAQRGDSFLIW